MPLLDGVVNTAQCPDPKDRDQISCGPKLPAPPPLRAEILLERVLQFSRIVNCVYME